MEGKKLRLKDYARYGWVLFNPQKLAILLILYAAEVLEEMEMGRKPEAES